MCLNQLNSFNTSKDIQIGSNILIEVEHLVVPFLKHNAYLSVPLPWIIDKS